MLIQPISMNTKKLGMFEESIFRSISSDLASVFEAVTRWVNTAS